MYKDCSGHLATTLYVLILHIAHYFTPEDIQVKVSGKKLLSQSKGIYCK